MEDGFRRGHLSAPSDEALLDLRFDMVSRAASIPSHARRHSRVLHAAISGALLMKCCSRVLTGRDVCEHARSEELHLSIGFRAGRAAVARASLVGDITHHRTAPFRHQIARLGARNDVGRRARAPAGNFTLIELESLTQHGRCPRSIRTTQVFSAGASPTVAGSRGLHRLRRADLSVSPNETRGALHALYPTTAATNTTRPTARQSCRS